LSHPTTTPHPAGKLSKGEKLAAVDHATMDYPHFRRRFYIEVPEIQRMTEEEVNLARKTEGVKVSPCPAMLLCPKGLDQCCCV
jgi:hypothetical protein